MKYVISVGPRSMHVKRLSLVLWVLPVFSYQSKITECEVKAKTETGWVCGVRRYTEEGTQFASFLNVPYAKQPVGELRFAELQPAEPWEGLYDATTEGPICPQDTFNYFTGLMRTNDMDDACIHLNVHTTMTILPKDTNEDKPLKPILVFAHGGGFVYGAGHTDLYGPEYLIDKGVIVITFNYRIGVYGFLSLNSTKIPGNNGLRDAVTLLKWVRRNAKYFGGDPDNVTLGGESAGSAMTHILTLSNATDGLLKRAILMSGSGVHGFYTASPAHAKSVADLFLSFLKINTTDPEEIHTQLTELPMQDILNASIKVQKEFGLVSFCPTVEIPVPGFTTIIEADPEDLLNNGNGKDIPILLSYTSNEAVFFKLDFEAMDIVTQVNNNPLLALSPDLVSKTSPSTALKNAKKADKRYYNGQPNVEKHIKCFSETSFVFPIIKLAETRKNMGSPTFLFEFAYEANFDPIKITKNITYKGASHVQDLTFLFRTNYLEGTPGFSPPTRRDKLMRELLTTYFANFTFCSNPTCSSNNEISSWPPLKKEAPITYQEIKDPELPHLRELNEEKQEMMRYFDDLLASQRRTHQRVGRCRAPGRLTSGEPSDPTQQILN